MCHVLLIFFSQPFLISADFGPIKLQIYSDNLTIFYQYDNWLLDVILAFGPWVGLGLSRPYQT